MDDRESVFGECETEEGEFDIGRFAERILLFERVVLRSNRLREVTFLAEALGADALTKLVNRGALRFDCNAYGMGSADRGPFTYELRFIRGQGEGTRAQKFLKAALDALPALRHVEREKLENAVERQLARLPDDFGSPSLKHSRRDLEANIPSIHTGALIAASELVGMKIRPVDLELRVLANAGLFTVESNLLKIGLDESQADKVARGALLGVAGVEYRLEQMKVHNSICILRESEVAVLNDKLQYTFDQTNAGSQLRRFGRVLRLKDFPDFSSAARKGEIDWSRLLEARDSDECVRFRRWLRSIDDVSDDELETEMRSVRARLGTIVRSPSGKMMRLAISTTAGGAVGGPIGFVAGLAASAADSFLVEQVFPRGGAHAFLDDAVRSILRQ